MSKYTDTDELLKAMDTWDKFGFSHSGAFVREPENDDYVPYVHYDDMVKCVEGMPTADVRENVHGKWVEREVVENKKIIEEWQSAKCSVCGKYHTTPYLYYFYNFNYCPNCGAKMDGEQKNEK